MDIGTGSPSIAARKGEGKEEKLRRGCSSSSSTCNSSMIHDSWFVCMSETQISAVTSSIDNEVFFCAVKHTSRLCLWLGSRWHWLQLQHYPQTTKGNMPQKHHQLKLKGRDANRQALILAMCGGWRWDKVPGLVKAAAKEPMVDVVKSAWYRSPGAWRGVAVLLWLISALARERESSHCSRGRDDMVPMVMWVSFCDGSVCLLLIYSY